MAWSTYKIWTPFPYSPIDTSFPLTLTTTSGTSWIPCKAFNTFTKAAVIEGCAISIWPTWPLHAWICTR